MTSQKLIAPSLLSADFARLGEEIAAVEKAGADIIHLDIMDGHFVPNITFGPPVIKSLRKTTKLPFDVHLMIENPQNYIQAFRDAGADWISVHVEEGYHLDRSLQMIRESGAKAGIVLNPATPLSAIVPILASCDFVLLMTVNPGFGGQKFIPYCRDKIRGLRKMIDAHGLNVKIEIDGGVKADNIAELAKDGADVFVAGSAVFESHDYAATLANMKKAING